MARRSGLIVAIAAMAFLATSEAARACRCMNRLMNGCGCRSACRWASTCQSCCEPVGCCDPCTQVAPAAASPAAAPTENKAAPPAPPAPVLPRPASGYPAPQASQVKPEVMRDVKPELAAPEPKPAAEPVSPKPPAIAAPKDVETPAEPRAVAKPELPPVLPPAKPAAPEELPVLKPPAKPADAKPPVPEKKDDPFGTRNDVKTLRQWSDASGKYHIEARFVSFQDGTVRLQKADGRYYRVKYDRLCAGDKDFVLHQDGAQFAAE
jgi:hypothetical protein